MVSSSSASRVQGMADMDYTWQENGLCHGGACVRPVHEKGDVDAQLLWASVRRLLQGRN